MCELQIRGLALVDAGEYSCVCGQEKTSTTLHISGKDVWQIGSVGVYGHAAPLAHPIFCPFVCVSPFVTG